MIVVANPGASIAISTKKLMPVVVAEARDTSDTWKVKSVIPAPGYLAYPALGMVKGLFDDRPPETPNFTPSIVVETTVTDVVIVVPSQSGFPFASLTVMDIGADDP